MTRARRSGAAFPRVRFRTLAAALLWIATLAGVSAGAEERILAYAAQIEIAADGSMEVTETIRVRAEGDLIQRGIFRDFPTDYRDRLGNRYRVGFEVLGVTRDGSREEFFLRPLSNGQRVYMGRADYFLPVGEYEYSLRYRTDRQLGFFEDHDELYWNVTGNGWDFPIDAARATVMLPEAPDADSLAIEGYIGPVGSAERAGEASAAGSSASIVAGRPLGPREGLTIVATWPKGIVAEPTLWQRFLWLLADNRGLLFALLGFGGALAYLLFVWNRVGRDPAPGVIFPRYEPPRKLSPASVRYVLKMGYDTKALTVAIMNLAVKGHVEIYEANGEYTLTKNDDARAPLAPGEQAVLDEIFAAGGVFVLDKKDHGRIAAAMRAHGRALGRDYHKTYFLLNWAYVLPGLLILGVAFLATVLTGAVSVLPIVVFAGGVVMLGVFVYLLRAPTALGRKALDEIEGFKEYLEIAEKDELALRNPPERTPELFEAYLPYALALSVEQPWAERFASVFERLAAERGRPYQPIWYHGTWDGGRHGGVGQLTRMTSAVSSAVVAAATPPGSSSGSGGGGSSGGGGGGGGGGGW